MVWTVNTEDVVGGTGQIPLCLDPLKVDWNRSLNWVYGEQKGQQGCLESPEPSTGCVALIDGQIKMVAIARKEEMKRGEDLPQEPKHSP